MTHSPDKAGLEPFDVSIDRDAEVPMGVQLGWALCSHIRDGGLRPGQRLPALRDMAAATGLNINTVRTVYQRLEQKGLIDTQQGSGTFVASTARGSSGVATIAANAAREARESGLDPREVAAALYVSGESAAGPTDPASAHRRVLRTQIAVLERAIGEIEAGHADLPPAAASRGGSGPTLLGIDQLEQVRTQLVRRLAIVQGAIDRHADEAAAASERDAAERATAVTRKRPTKRATPKKTKRTARPRSGTRPAPAGT
jgi:GntR family transcriptional regulator